ncbi:uncharacterized protein LOC131018771 [Salvia miltiorrhiza]|uniref:uncharacterized protein LOC131018771 n=1 Tax=Salvia miltiorrhiza TaxID=226208 RepID=UPI0025ACFE15|nr:uncharacterized protein LOC131018771 [Salvia miltiorrhiza]
MADSTRLKELHEAQKKMDQLLQAELLQRTVTEERMKELIAGLDQKVDAKYDQLSNIMGDIRRQLQAIGPNKESSGSILGPSPGSIRKEGNHARNTAFTSKIRSDYSSPSSFNSGNTVHRIDFPKFNGTNPRGWILKCNTYFKLTAAMPDENMIQLSVHNFEGKALQWLQNFGCENLFSITWEQFMDVVAARFEDLNEGMIVMEFKNLKQVGTYEEYVEKFEELRACLLLSNRMTYSEEYSSASFISGILEELQGLMLLFKPKTLIEAIEIGNFTNQVTSYKRPERGGTTNKLNNQGNSKTPVKILTAAEMAVRREKGLCFNYDEKFFAGHKCKHKSFYMEMTEAQELAYLQHEEDTVEVQIDENEPMEEVHVNLHSMVGGVSSKTMRVIGKIGDSPIRILLDTGSTLSFLQEKFAKMIGVKLEPVSPILIKVANGQKLISKKRAADLSWEVQGHRFTYSPRVLASDGYDLILGSDWLEYCSPITLDYKGMTFTVHQGSQRIKLRAKTDQARFKDVLSHSLYHMMHYHLDEVEEIYLVDCQQALVGKSNITPELEHLLREFHDIFAEPQGLPPVRSTEHQILLKSRSVPKHQYPYRTSHSNKNEIEKIVQAMFEAGIIQHSKSPFASLVILVKKKEDGSWRMCVDYRYLNSLTVKHDFPIPLIDELLDELHGAKFFSKLDRRSATFQSLMNQVFQPYLRRFVLAFFDDIIVYSKTEGEHLLHLRHVLTVMREQSLFAKGSKCQFHRSEIEYLGHIISGEGVATDPSKIGSMVNCLHQ